MSRPRAADDFAAIRQRLDELRREREAAQQREAPGEGGERFGGRGLGAVDRRYRDRAEGAPPPWVPTIFIRKRPG